VSAGVGRFRSGTFLLISSGRWVCNCSGRENSVCVCGQDSVCLSLGSSAFFSNWRCIREAPPIHTKYTSSSVRVNLSGECSALVTRL